MKKQWKINDLTEKFLDSNKYPKLILNLLASRGLYEESEIEDFLNPDYSKLLDPYLFKDMSKSTERVLKAIETNELILIYADYDADAITALSVVYLGLKKLGANLTYYIPDRFTEGYGLNVDAIKQISKNGVGLMITVDCGINATEEAKILKESNIDLIITDHHELTGDLPDAFSIINPKNPNDTYPFQYLTGVGVAYKLIQALFSAPRLVSAHSGQPAVPAGWEKWLLDLVAIGTVADCQNLTGENRILVSFGLQVLKKTIWPGLKALVNNASYNTAKIDTFTLGFIIAPRINAAGRIAHANTAFELLIAQDQDQADKLAKGLNQLNSHRQGLTEQISSEARAQVEILGDKKVLLVSGDDWPKGVIGLVAGRLVEEYGRPTLVIEKGKIEASGSARSINSFNIVEALNYSAKYLIKYGGHHQAAGFRLETKNIDNFYKNLLEYADQNLLDTNLIPILSIDLELKPGDLTWDNFNLIEKFEPFGVGNPRPKFVSHGLKVLNYKQVGENNKHLKLVLDFGGKKINAIAFRQGFRENKLSINQTIDCVFELSNNEWNGNKNLELKILDINI